MGKYSGKYSAKKKKRSTPLIPILLSVTVLLAGLAATLLLSAGVGGSHEALRTGTAPHPVLPTEAPGKEYTALASDVVPIVEETLPPILPELAENAAQNPDLVGWIKIDGTKINYPLMYTPEDPEKYLHKDFNGHFSVGGLPFLDEKCTLEPASDNLLIYGHNMQNGTMFQNLLLYEQKGFWQEHPIIRVSTLYQEKSYEILAALYDRVYFKSEVHFKFYQFINAADEHEFDEAISYFREHALYDTGVTAQYGDKLVTLVTCAYHVDNGRFLVVAREITNQRSEI